MAARSAGRCSAGSRFLVFTAAFVAVVGGSPNDDKLPQELGVDDSTAALLAVAFLVSVVAPVAEEFFFRGYFFTALRNWRGLWPAAIGTGHRLRGDPRQLGATPRSCCRSRSSASCCA